MSAAARTRSFAGSGRGRAVGHGLVLAGLIVFGFIFLVLAPRVQSFGIDAFSYWVKDVNAVYQIPHREVGAFPYTPPMAAAMRIFGTLSWVQFLWLWTALLVASLIWIGGSAGWIVAAFAIPFVALELYHGNIHILLAVAILLGFRHPWTWSFVLLTKFTAGVGLLWFVVRGEWRSLAIALGTTAILCLLTFLIWPHLWWEWIDYVLAAEQIGLDPHWINHVRVPLSVRLVTAVMLVVWGARTDRRWTVLVAATWALPILWIHGLAMLVGLIYEWRRVTPGVTPSLASRALARIGWERRRLEPETP